MSAGDREAACTAGGNTPAPDAVRDYLLLTRYEHLVGAQAEHLLLRLCNELPEDRSLRDVFGGDVALVGVAEGTGGAPKVYLECAEPYLDWTFKKRRAAITQLLQTPYGEQRLRDETELLAAMESEAESRHERDAAKADADAERAEALSGLLPCTCPASVALVGMPQTVLRASMKKELLPGQADVVWRCLSTATAPLPRRLEAIQRLFELPLARDCPELWSSVTEQDPRCRRGSKLSGVKAAEAEAMLLQMAKLYAAEERRRRGLQQLSDADWSLTGDGVREAAIAQYATRVLVLPVEVDSSDAGALDAPAVPP